VINTKLAPQGVVAKARKNQLADRTRDPIRHAIIAIAPAKFVIFLLYAFGALYRCA